MTDVRLGRRDNLVIVIVSLAFLAVTVLSGPRHDYFLYLHMWYEVRQGHDPWFIVPGVNGNAPLNAYGPAFNLLAALSWVNPLAPKLLFAYGFVLFAISQIKGFTASRPSNGLQLIVLTALFWNPFPWIEIAGRGHFDILIGLLCLGAIRGVEPGSRHPRGDVSGPGRVAEILPGGAFALPRLRSRPSSTSVSRGGRGFDRARSGAELLHLGSVDASRR